MTLSPRHSAILRALAAWFGETECQHTGGRVPLVCEHCAARVELITTLQSFTYRHASVTYSGRRSVDSERIPLVRLPGDPQP